MDTRDTVFIAIFAAFTAALAVFPPITLPVIGVPITAQSLGAIVAGGVLGAKRGSLSLVLFLVLVAAGLPLLSGGRGGFAVFMGPTGGFLIGWILTAFFVGLLVEQLWSYLNFFTALVASAVGGIVVLYAIGIPWSATVAGIPLSTALAGSLPFIPGDILKSVIAASVIVITKNSYPIISPKERTLPGFR
ncbi:biotin transporter BioY [Rhizobium sp. CECT 9324]|uniref:biotin transporter BioY n=1 Tax=Rhizobium sp. CECT 9324 TaxID=2845820 RepID=UPI001E35252A|nr:biotin transporter BioY [Rhizobium sp. CECT 9324]CAH0338848.1 Biotin transporter BioY [Rhizobium sp. CECT 9324]